MSITPYLPQLLVAWLAYFIAVISPGPATMAIISASVNRGRPAGMSLAMGVMTGSIIWASAAALGLSALLLTYANALFVMKILGGLYLFWLAIQAFRAALRDDALPAGHALGAEPGYGRLYLKGLMVHLTNPKAVFVWLALVSLGLPHDAPWYVTPVFILVCFVIGTITMNAVALFFSLPPVLAGYRRVRRLIDFAMAGFFAFAGFELVTSRI